MTVALGSRDVQKGRQAADSLGYDNVTAYQRDVTDQLSAEKLANKLQQTYGRLDILINNAGINYDTFQTVLNADLESVHETFEANALGAWRVIQVMLPLLKKSRRGRIVNVSSGAGALASMTGGTPAYSLSKLALNGMTMMFARSLKSQSILVNAVCPGWVATNMGGAGGRPIKEGAASVVWAALLADDGPTGGFFRDGKRLDWLPSKENASRRAYLIVRLLSSN